MPVHGDAPVGPFPEGADHEEFDKLRRRVLWKMPSGLYVVGATDKGERRNGMTLNWASQLGFDPKLLGISVEREAFTHELIAASRAHRRDEADSRFRGDLQNLFRGMNADMDKLVERLKR